MERFKVSIKIGDIEIQAEDPKDFPMLITQTIKLHEFRIKPQNGEVIEKLHKIQQMNERLQKNYSVEQGHEKQNVNWHRHETIDDLLHEILAELGD